MKLRVFLEAFLEHGHASHHVLVFLELDTVLLFGEFAAVVFDHLIFKLLEGKFFRSQEG